MWFRDEIKAAHSIAGRFDKQLTKEEGELAESLRSRGLLLLVDSRDWHLGWQWVWTQDALADGDVQEAIDGWW